MTSPIGFVLVSHRAPEQVVELCRRLDKHFGGAPIALHHDVSQSQLPINKLPGNVLVVPDPVRTRWGHSSVLYAVLKALTLLDREASPEWTISLSAADYPVKTAAKILEELNTNSADAFLDFREISYTPQPHATPTSPAASFHNPQWMDLAVSRYVLARVWGYSLLEKAGIPKHAAAFRAWFSQVCPSPFSAKLRPYGGDAWFTVNRRAARRLVDDSPLRRRLLRHYTHRLLPEESYYQTLLCNQPDLTVENNNRRFTRWMGGRHPQTLTAAELPEILASNAHFARKFEGDPAVYDEVDRLVQQ